MNTIEYDAIIIGFGKGGKTLAGKLAQEGKKVAVVEQDPGMYGGTCINVGCIPSKSLILSAAGAKDAASQEEKNAYFQQAIAEKRRLTAMLRKKNFDKLAENKNVTIYDGKARFVGDHLVEVNKSTDSGSIRLQGEQLFINTGSTAFIPPIDGIHETKGVYTSKEMMDLEKLPEHLMILGGGYIGLEFASMFAAFGSQVTVIQNSGVFLPKEDEDIAGEIKKILEDQGIRFLFNAKTTKIRDGARGPVLSIESQGDPSRSETQPKIQPEDRREFQLEGDALLVATGRIPNTKDLACEAAGIELTARGAIKVDEKLRTTADGVWAMGDVTGGLQHTYISLDDFRIVWAQLSGQNGRSAADRENVPYSVFLKTPYSHIGINEREAREAGYNIRVLKLPVAAVPKAQVLRKPEGVMKVILEVETDRILGAMLLCEESYEMINLIGLAMELGSPYTVLRDRIYTHPTMTEAFNDLFAL
ncbi:MAG: FAD-dependent oxidoreductase [Bacillota bacterium]|nr:FAD-dependent oxidoreductase [Bacillota bacterium]